MSMRLVRTVAIAAAVCLLSTGCATRLVGVLSPIQLRMADPLVMKDDQGYLNPALIRFQQYAVSGKNSASMAANVNPRKPIGKPRVAAFVVDDEPFKNRVDLETDAWYEVNIFLPNNFEDRRLALLQLKMETLYEAIEEADARLRANTEREVQLLDDAARASLIRASAQLRDKIAETQQSMIMEGASTRSIEAAIQPHVDQLAVNEQRLRDDDVARDKLLSPSLVESLVNQIEDWRAELNTLKSRVVALELMVQNTNDPYPRIINGWLETRSQTPFTMSGAIPFVIEDEYLDWIRHDRVVTIVSYDPNQAPEDETEANRRATFTHYWPQEDLMVVEFDETMSGVPRSSTAGTRPNTRINQRVYENVRATTFTSDSGVERTYLMSDDSKAMWVFGPDVTSPANIEVWTLSEMGEPVQKLYPPDAREQIDEVYVRQIAGVEGGSFDPVEEAKRRGTIIAVTRIGNKLQTSDQFEVREAYPKQLEKAKEQD